MVVHKRANDRLHLHTHPRADPLVQLHNDLRDKRCERNPSDPDPGAHERARAVCLEVREQTVRADRLAEPERGSEGVEKRLERPAVPERSKQAPQHVDALRTAAAGLGVVEGV
jgi:hypothetical protein